MNKQIADRDGGSSGRRLKAPASSSFCGWPADMPQTARFPPILRPTSLRRHSFGQLSDPRILRRRHASNSVSIYCVYCVGNHSRKKSERFAGSNDRGLSKRIDAGLLMPLGASWGPSPSGTFPRVFGQQSGAGPHFPILSGTVTV